MIQNIAYVDDSTLHTYLARLIDVGHFIDAVVWREVTQLYMVIHHEQN